MNYHGLFEIRANVINMSYLPGEVKENLESLSTSLSSLGELLKPLQEFKSLSQLNSHLHLQESLKLNVALAYTLNSLYYILMKLQGKNTVSHPITREIEHIKSVVFKVQQALQASSSLTNFGNN